MRARADRGGPGGRGGLRLSLVVLAAAVLPAAGCFTVDLPPLTADPVERTGMSLPLPPEGGYNLARPYPLLPGDVITISVREDPDLGITITIPYNGVIEVYKSEVGGGEREPVTAQGKTVDELKDEITEVYKRTRVSVKLYVQVVLDKAVPRQVFVRGATKSENGAVPLSQEGRMTLFRALQVSGGWDPLLADLSRVTIERTDPATGAKASLPSYNLEEMMENATYDRDPPLEPGDIITIPVLGEVTIFGNINQPGRYRCRRKMTLLDLLADAGGLKPFSKLSDVRVTRNEGTGREQTYRVNVNAILDSRAVDPRLAPGDRVWIDETWK